MTNTNLQVFISQTNQKVVIKNAKACSKICVDIILNEYNCLIQTKAHENYWNAVKQEIEKIMKDLSLLPNKEGFEFIAVLKMEIL
ncbi:MAG: hypothetical protein IPQ23_22160 [Cytophagaceae bacterium]|nr:hypothetical protein [Cytophagaceae bacterium]